ncbi:MAG TPA: glycosyltransferase family 4 protein [Patescibacteria group bacterium]|nr:glycosyltransferase family 4 protein [Patescibacteria group bacterium]
MKIIFLDLDDIKNPLLGAGQAIATREVGKRLVKRGHKVIVYCSKYPNYKDRTEDGIVYKHVGLNTKNIKINNFAYIFTIPFVVKNIQNADIIVECFTAPVSTLLSPLFTKIPVVALPTSFDAKRFSKNYHLPFWLIEKYGSRAYKYFIALTPYLDNKMKKYNPKIKTKIIPQGVSSDYLTVTKNKKAEYILFIGRLDINQKGLDLLLESFAKIADKVSYPLVIAGDGPDAERVRSLIDKLDLSKKVKLVGFADKKKKIELFSGASFVAFPSRNEGFSLVSLEAIVSGNRLVSFDIPSLYWANSDVARKTKPFNTKKYSEALLDELNTKNKIKLDVLRKKYFEKYSWDSVSNQFEYFFQDILAK